jgi:hypothetical protein
MTAARQQRKRLTGRALAVMALCGFGLGAAAGQSALDGRVLVNPATGLALSGYDPLAYFIDGKPKLGRAAFEISLGGAVWRFENDGNRAAFAEHPEIYLPQFNGYDPAGIARGVSVPGNPAYWAVAGERLYLFYDEAARRDFLAAPDRVLDAAGRKWPDLMRTLPH